MRLLGGPEHYASALVLLALASPAQAAVTDYLGRNIAEVHVQSGTQEVREPALLEILDTKVGEPLAMAHVRETLAHLFGLGRYQDIQVDAAMSNGGVVLTYRLIGVQRVRSIAFQGDLALRESQLRQTVIDRYGVSPSVARAPEVERTLQTLYRDRGYPNAQISSRLDAPAGSEGATLVFVVQAGARARIGTIDVQGTPLDPAPMLLRKVELKAGDPYDGVAVDSRLAKYADEMRGLGYYEARVAQLPRYVDQDQTVNLTVSVEAGPHVEIVFKGDALTPRERDELVPIAREHSVDEDILEDAKFGIEAHFRALGYCNARADYQRDTAGTVLTITFSITRGPQCVLEEAQITGNTSVTTAELTPLLRSVVGQPFNENLMGADAARIQGLYKRRGFARVKIAPDIVRGDAQSGVAPVRVRMVITEGVKSVIQSVVFDGNSAIAADVLRESVTSSAGQLYFEPQIATDADALAQIYLNRGYPEATVQPSVRPAVDLSAIELHFAIHEGPQVFVDHVLIVGNRRTKTETIAREVQLKSGQPLSQQEEDETRSRITALGIFRRVDISYLRLPGALTHRDVLITVEEAPVTTISYGGGLEGGRRTTNDPVTGDAVETFQVAPRGFFTIGRRNLFGGDRSLNLFTRVSFRSQDATEQEKTLTGYGFNEYLARLTYAERRIFGTPTDGTLSAGVEQGARTSFDFNRRSANVTLGRRLSHSMAASGRYSIERTRLFNTKQIDPADVPLIDRLFPQVRLSAFSGSLLHDTRDDALDPGAGGLVGVDGELAARRIGSEVGFFKSSFQGFAYRRLGKRRTVAALGARLGLATGFPRTVTTVDDAGQTVVTIVDDLPASERFFAGGDTTVRGFALDRLGRPDTIDPQGFPKGGHGLIVLNAELRTPLVAGLGAVGFIDAGNVFLHVNDMRLGQIRTAVGFGLRYRSPIGPIRMDLGIKLAPQTQANGTRERATALHISLGQAF